MKKHQIEHTRQRDEHTPQAVEHTNHNPAPQTTNTQDRKHRDTNTSAQPQQHKP